MLSCRSQIRYALAKQNLWKTSSLTSTSRHRSPPKVFFDCGPENCLVSEFSMVNKYEAQPKQPKSYPLCLFVHRFYSWMGWKSCSSHKQTPNKNYVISHRSSSTFSFYVMEKKATFLYVCSYIKLKGIIFVIKPTVLLLLSLCVEFFGDFG